MKLAIIGCGAVSEMWHIPATVELLGVENVSLIDSDPGRLGAMAEKFGISATASDLSRLGTSPDAALIATPPHTHPAIAEAAFGHGLHVLCEKPLANTSTECSRMIGAARESGRILAVCHTYRFFPSRLRLREMLLADEFGKVSSVDIEEGTPSDWPTTTGYTFRKGIVPGGVLLNEGIHSLDFLFWVFGMPTEYEYVDDSLGGVESNARLRMILGGKVNVSFRTSRTDNPFSGRGL